jgi:glycosyltransferase involved in cell wall biosynthesis
MPSEKESFGLAALEAMACEVPVISSNTGGLPELNIHGVTGFMSDVGDVDDMVKNALIILQDDKLPEFKANALKRAQEFDVHKIRPLYEAMYERVVASAAVQNN